MAASKLATNDSVVVLCFYVDTSISLSSFFYSIQGMLQILVAICVLTGYSITTASFAIYEVSEHNSGAKRLQHIAGISEPFYWTVNFLYDMVASWNLLFCTIQKKDFFII